MLPVIALVGRPNVGKSTLFNRLTRSSQALVLDMPGVTRDRQFGHGYYEDHSFIVIDTGGIEENMQGPLEKHVVKQALQAIEEADCLFFVVDGRQGLNVIDKQIASVLRKKEKPVYLVVNKSEGLNEEVIKSDFYSLGFDKVYTVTATHNRGIATLLEDVLEAIAPITPDSGGDNNPLSPKVAMIGRPNVGKSTLVNRMFGEERVVVCDEPGTTRDSIYVPMKRFGKTYTLIDTAGVRKKQKVTEVVEKFSIIKTLQAIKDADVVLLVFDAHLGLSDQDLSLIQITIEAGRGLIICANKWDGLEDDQRKHVKDALNYRLKFASFARIHFISALHGTGVGELFPMIDAVYQSALSPLNTRDLSQLLEKAIEMHAPPLVHGRRIKLRYAHCGGHQPPTIVIHGNQTEEVPLSYQKYLSNFFIKALKLDGTPVKLIFKTGDNPFKGRRNVLTKRQAYKRARLMDHVRKQKKREK